MLNLEIGAKVVHQGETAVIRDLAYREMGLYVSATQGSLEVWLEFEDSSITRRWVDVSEIQGVSGVLETDTFLDQDDRSPHLLDLGYSMVAWSDGLEDRPDNSKLPAIVTLLMAIQYDKEGHYGSSWKGKGEYRGIMANIDRKYDRLDKMTDDEIAGSIRSLAVIEKELVEGVVKQDAVGESKIDAIADLANYCLLYLTYVKEKYPRVFKIWVDRNIPKYLADKIPFI